MSLVQLGPGGGLGGKLVVVWATVVVWVVVVVATANHAHPEGTLHPPHPPPPTHAHAPTELAAVLEPLAPAQEVEGVVKAGDGPRPPTRDGGDEADVMPRDQH